MAADDQAKPTAAELARARARVSGVGQPLGGVGPAGSKIDGKSPVQRAAEARGASAGRAPQPLGGVDPNPRPETERQSKRVDTGGQPLGGVGPPGSRIPKGGGGSVIVGRSPADLLRLQAAQAAERQKAVAAAPEADTEADTEAAPKKAAKKKAAAKKPKGDG